MKRLKLLPVVFVSTVLTNAFCQQSHTFKSPDERISVTFGLTLAGEPVYSVSHSGSPILKESKLGVVRSDDNFSTNLTLDSVSDKSTVSDSYTLIHGKRLNNSYTANKYICYLKNVNSKPIEIIFQLSNDGVAFRYHFPDETETPVRIFKEVTSWHFDPTTKAFLQPCPDARMGWNFSSPSYEENYQVNIPVGTNAPYQAGWVMPALFNSGKYWISITETAVDTNYCGSRLSQFSPDGEYSVQYPQPQEGRPGEPVLPESALPWTTPWRIMVVTDNLAHLVESTLGTDLAARAQYDVSSWLEPGMASWSWVILKDDSTVYDVQQRFIDFASEMNWEYCLIDAFWDTQIGYEKIAKLANYARIRDVKILLWYNSAGDWNTTPLTPRDKMLTRESRRAEFQKLQDMGIAGVKVDFFAGDGQSMMKYYIDILKDAADYNLAVNFHGCTLPRGWHRTYPNLVSMESIKGEEFVTFGQEHADRQPTHCTVIPFTRNLFDPMDFTPVNFSGIPNIQRRTTGGFELALSVLFTSGIQHIAETPSGMATQTDFVREYMSTFPETWDDVKFIDGFPGKFVVLARRKGDIWYIGGINGETTPRTLTFETAFIGKKSRGILITDSRNSKDFMKSDINLSKPVSVTMLSYGGFIIQTQSK